MSTAISGVNTADCFFSHIMSYRESAVVFQVQAGLPVERESEVGLTALLTRAPSPTPWHVGAILYRVGRSKDRGPMELIKRLGGILCGASNLV